METTPSADGVSIAFERTGGGPPLVLVHGTTADHTRWQPVLPALASRFTVHALDRRGRGKSGDAPEYSFEREVEDILTVIEAVGEPVHLLAHSFGAFLSLEAALRTDRLRQLILYEPPVPVGGYRFEPADAVPTMERLVAEGKDEEALLFFFREVAGVPPAELDILRNAPNWPARVASVHTILREVPAASSYVFQADRFTRMKTPTLLLLGSESPPAFRAATHAIHEALPDSRIVELPGQQHVAINTAPDLFANTVLDALTGD